jgi:hypothetical protein
MDHKSAWIRIACVQLIACACAWSTAVHAQVEAEGQASGSSDIELGATSPSRIEMTGGTSGRGPAQSDGDIRLALQLRIDAINTLSLADPAGVVGAGIVDLGRHLLVPVATPGVRLIEDRLFIGLGFGFVGASTEDGPNEESRSGFSVSPLASYDVLDNDAAALSLLGWLNLASLGETEQCTAAGCADQNDDAFGWGLSLGAGLRGFLTDSVAVGGELGWGFLSIASDAGGDAFVHGVFANLLLEASIML